MSFALIDAKKADIPVETACAVLNVSVSGFYAWKHRPASKRQIGRFGPARAYPLRVRYIERDLWKPAHACGAERTWLGSGSAQGGAADERKRPESASEDSIQEDYRQTTAGR